MLKFKELGITNEKFKEWYKQGFESNKEGSTLKTPEKYKKGEVIFKHYYELGVKEYKEQQSDNQQAAAAGIGAIALTWLVAEDSM